MHRPADAHRDEFNSLGYTVFEGVLTPAEIAEGVAAIDAILTPETHAPVTTSDASNRNGRRQLTAEYCSPKLALLGSHPRVVEAAERLGVGPLRLMQSPIPCSTFKSPPGGERLDWGHHVDWPHRPPEPGDETYVNGMIYLSTVEPGGGGLMVIPGSHRAVLRAMADPALRERAVAQDFKGFPGLAEPREMCVPAGGLLFFHSYLVHDRSENFRDQPRKVVFMHLKPRTEDERQSPSDVGKRFHPDHLAAMDTRTRWLCGIE